MKCRGVYWLHAADPVGFFDKKKASDWTVEGLTTISRHSVIGANKYNVLDVPKETISDVMDGRTPKLLMDIHTISEVNKPGIDLSELDRAANSADFTPSAP
ncbi:MAG: hypothetical protein EOO38_00525 [Cytophagaceae bacterium]|nr:MAG: hypothetical protein EOO38_00525 [Cytophagaceae bacterium]